MRLLQVVRSTEMGNSRASERGTGSKFGSHAFCLCKAMEESVLAEEYRMVWNAANIALLLRMLSGGSMKKDLESFDSGALKWVPEVSNKDQEIKCNINDSAYKSRCKAMLLCFLLAVICSLRSYAETVTIIDDHVKYEIDEETQTAVAVALGFEDYPYKGNHYYRGYTYYTIKSKVSKDGKEYHVKSIGDLTTFNEANYTCEKAMTVSSTIMIEEGVETIDYSAFSGIDIEYKMIYGGELKKYRLFSDIKISLPKTIKRINKYAFSGVTINNLQLPSNLEEIGEGCFRFCKGINNLIIPNSVKVIGPAAFSKCTDLTTLTLSNSLEAIPADAFYGCYKLESVDVPRSVETIGAHAFSGCKGMKQVGLPSWLASIGDGVFQNCETIGSINIPQSVAYIGKAAFAGCSMFRSATIPAGITNLPDSVFCGCRSLTEISLPAGLKSIGERAFYGCSISKGLLLPEGLESIGVSSFVNCKFPQLVIPESTIEIGQYAFSGNAALVSANIGPGIKSLPAETFRNCTSLKELSLSSNLTEIGELCFDGCSLLKEITSDNPVPPAAKNNTFAEAAYDNALVLVPANVLTTYRSAPVWKYFSNYDVIVKSAQAIVVSPSRLSGVCGDSGNFSLTVIPEDAAISDITWSSSDSEIVSVSVDGSYVLGSKIGEATVTASAQTEGGARTLSATCEVTVLPTMASAVILDRSELTLKVGTTDKISAKVLPETTSNQTIVWSSSNDDVAAVSADGIVTAISVGEAVVMARCGSVTAECRVTVEPIEAISIELNLTRLELPAKSVFGLVAFVFPENTTDKTVVWSSDDSSIASVDEHGFVTGVSVGSTTIRAICGNATAICMVKVTPPLIESIFLNYSELEVSVGQSVKLETSIYPEDAAYTVIEWMSDNEECVSVDANGVVTGLKEGRAIVSAYWCDIFANCVVNVRAEKIEWDQTIHCAVGDKIELTAESSAPELVRYRSIRPDGGYQVADISCENGKWYASFNGEGAHVLEAYLEGNEDVKAERRFNVVSSHDGLFYINGIYYRYTDDTCASYKVVRGYNMYVGDYMIPARVNGIAVDRIDNFAFYSCEELGSVTIDDGIRAIGIQAFGNGSLSAITIPKSVTEMSDYVFNALKGRLLDIYLQAMIPLVVKDNIFNGFVDYNACVLHVPYGTTEVYRQANVWKNFIHIVEDQLSGVGVYDADACRVTVEDGVVSIDGVQAGAEVRIIKIDGTEIFRSISAGTTISFAPESAGLYIVKTGIKTRKLIVR